MVKSQLIIQFKHNWLSKLSKCEEDNAGKIRTYAFKNIFKCENYLNVIKDGKIRSCLTKFRISAHKLEIEKGRYSNTPLNNRICKFCNWVGRG